MSDTLHQSSNLRMVEFFSGSGRMAQAFREQGWIAKTVDIEYPADMNRDVLTLTREDIIALCGGEPDFMWFSFPCTGFSVSAIGTHWGGGWRVYEPKTETARMGIQLIEWCNTVRSWFPNAKWGYENPRGVARKMKALEGLPRYTITFCQYGERRMKPTDIWTNLVWVPRPMCKNGAQCHDRAPRGAKTGTQGLKNAYLRGTLPIEFCKEIAFTATTNLRRVELNV